MPGPTTALRETNGTAEASAAAAPNDDAQLAAEKSAETIFEEPERKHSENGASLGKGAKPAPKSCIICCERPVCLLACDHAICCAACAAIIAARSRWAAQRALEEGEPVPQTGGCPLCRAPIEFGSWTEGVFLRTYVKHSRPVRAEPALPPAQDLESLLASHIALIDGGAADDRGYDAIVRPGESISDAVGWCARGGRVLIKPGTYRSTEPLVIAKDVALIGRGKVTLTTSSADVIRVTGGARVTLAGLALRCTLPEPPPSPESGPPRGTRGTDDVIALRSWVTRHPHAAAAVRGGGQLALIRCDISSESPAAIEATAGAGGAGDPPAVLLVSACKIHSCSNVGVFLSGATTRALVKDTIVQGSRAANVFVDGAKPVLTSCQVLDGLECGLLYSDGAGGELQSCAILRNAFAGVEIRDKADPLVHGCKIARGGAGVLISGGGRGAIEACAITSCRGAGIEVTGDGSCPAVLDCAIDACDAGVFLHEAPGAAAGLFENCVVSRSRLAGVEVRGDAAPFFLHCTVERGLDAGLFCYRDGAGGNYLNCVLRLNAKANVAVREGGAPVVRDCTIATGKECGVLIESGGRGLFEGNDICRNAIANVGVCTAGGGTFLRNALRESSASGVVLEPGAGSCMFGENRIMDNAAYGLHLIKGLGGDAPPSAHVFSFSTNVFSSNLKGDVYDEAKLLGGSKSKSSKPGLNTT